MSNSFIPMVAAALLLLMIIFFNSIFQAIEGAFLNIFSPSRARDIVETPTFKKSSILSSMISIPLFAFCLTSCRVTDLSFLWTTVVLASCFIITMLSNALLTTLSGNFDVMDETRRSNNTFVIITTLSIPAVVYSLVVSDCNYTLPFIWIATIFCIFLSIRYFSLTSKIFSLKFSHFFTFLYLCGLKILPIAVAVKVLVF